MRIYIVIKNEIWDGENWDTIDGAFRREEDAKAQVREIRDRVFDDWSDETIEEDSDKAFHAYRDEEYNNYHVSIYIEQTELK